MNAVEERLKEENFEMSHMYHENIKSLNAFVGCLHDCVYCKPSFQRLCKRSKCPNHKTYTPHFHRERLLKAPPKTSGNEFVFFPSCGELSFATPEQILAHIDYAKKYPNTVFLTQAKNPKFFLDYKFPDNVILGTTIETNRTVFSTPSKYHYYNEISKAPEPRERYKFMLSFFHPVKLVTVEPVLKFNLLIMIDWMNTLLGTTKRLIIYVGYDNHNCYLPEPKLNETLDLVRVLKDHGFDVRTKNVERKAWYEK